MLFNQKGIKEVILVLIHLLVLPQILITWLPKAAVLVVSTMILPHRVWRVVLVGVLVEIRVLILEKEYKHLTLQFLLILELMVSELMEVLLVVLVGLPQVVAAVLVVQESKV